jgi:hypothetical protein
MQPINKLLDRIRWDREFGAAVFEIAYRDRLAGLIVKRPFVDLFFEPGNKESFLLMDKENMYQPIPPEPGARGVPEWRTDLAAARD